MPVPVTLAATLPGVCAGTYPFVFDVGSPFLGWQVRAVNVGTCVSPDTEQFLNLRCEDLGGGPLWWLYSGNFAQGPYGPSFARCDPFTLVFDGVDLTFCCGPGATNETVVITR